MIVAKSFAELGKSWLNEHLSTPAPAANRHRRPKKKFVPVIAKPLVTPTQSPAKVEPALDQPNSGSILIRERGGRYEALIHVAGSYARVFNSSYQEVYIRAQQWRRSMLRKAWEDRNVG